MLPYYHIFIQMSRIIKVPQEKSPNRSWACGKIWICLYLPSLWSLANLGADPIGNTCYTLSALVNLEHDRGGRAGKARAIIKLTESKLRRRISILHKTSSFSADKYRTASTATIIIIESSHNSPLSEIGLLRICTILIIHLFANPVKFKM